MFILTRAAGHLYPASHDMHVVAPNQLYFPIGHCMYVCMYKLYKCLCMYILCMYVCMYACMYVCMYMLYVYVCIAPNQLYFPIGHCMYVCLFVCMYV